MARLDQELYDKVRNSGVRKRVARTVAEAAGKADSKTPKALNDAAKNLRSIAAELEDRAKGGPAKRKAAAQKAARTRRTKAAAAQPGGQEGGEDARAKSKASGRVDPQGAQAVDRRQSTGVWLEPSFCRLSTVDCRLVVSAAYEP